MGDGRGVAAREPAAEGTRVRGQGCRREGPRTDFSVARVLLASARHPQGGLPRSHSDKPSILMSTTTTATPTDSSATTTAGHGTTIRNFLVHLLSRKPHSESSQIVADICAALNLEVGTHYSSEWLIEQVALITGKALPTMPAHEALAPGEAMQDVTADAAAILLPSPPAMASDALDVEQGAAVAMGDSPAELTDARPINQPVVDKHGHDITALELIVPPGAKPHSFFTFAVHENVIGLPRMIAEVPPLAKPGDKLTYGDATWWPEHGEPMPNDYQLLPVPKCKTLSQLLDGFVGLDGIPTSALIDELPTVIFNVPKPRLGDDLQCFQHRFAEWTLVEAKGVPQPGAWCHHPRGSTYEVRARASGHVCESARAALGSPRTPDRALPCSRAPPRRPSCCSKTSACCPRPSASPRARGCSGSCTSRRDRCASRAWPSGSRACAGACARTTRARSTASPSCAPRRSTKRACAR